MYKTLYLHIGTPKTGTTSIQHFITENKSLLRKQYDVLSHVINNKRIDRIDHILRELRFKNVLISNEGLWGSSCFLEDLEFLKSKNIEVRLIVYLRRQDEYFESLWNQSIKQSRVYNDRFESFLQNILNNNDIVLGDGVVYPLEKFDYLKTLDNMASIVGIDNIVVKIFEKSELKNGDLIQDFLEILNIDNSSVFVKQKDANNRLDGEYLEIKRLINKYVSDNDIENFNYYNFRVALQNICFEEKSDEREVYMDEVTRKKVLNVYGKDNEILASKYTDKHQLFNEEIKRYALHKYEEPDWIRESIYKTIVECFTIKKREEMYKRVQKYIARRMKRF